jgi:hypothetical protein
MIVDLQSRALFIAEDEPTAAYHPARIVAAQLAPTTASQHSRRSVVELQQFQGGMAPHVLVGGVYTPGEGALLVQLGVMAKPGRRRTCGSALGRRLIPGLTEDFVESVLGGISRTLDVGPGVLLIDRFGFDPVETSFLATELAAEILGRVLSEEEPPSESQAATWLEALP